jgi:hypothetical protein
MSCYQTVALMKPAVLNDSALCYIRVSIGHIMNFGSVFSEDFCTGSVEKPGVPG